jgi:hypothetical protein
MSSTSSKHSLSPRMSACWTRDGVAKALSNTANLTRSESHYFLTSHAPFRRIQNDRTGTYYNEGELFDALFRSSHRNVQAIVHGEPGSGKSHLIHWLKLRCEQEGLTDSGFLDFRSVLIERRNGSLKDALQQIVEQLGQDFAQYLESIRGAIRQISSETARQEVAGQLKLELGPRRRDRDLPTLPTDLKHLPECFVAPAFSEWLCREEGAIAEIVRRLINPTTVDERQFVVKFSADDFRVPVRYQRNNPPVVQELIDQFAESDELCQQASKFANDAIRDAVAVFTGLSGADLQSVFFDIRRHLATQGHRLALFVEDVSVMSALDRELIVALEPQKREGLCDLFVVVGMTDSGLETIRALPDNQLQRATYIFSVAQDDTQWGEDEDDIAAFVARYLNSTRLAEMDVRQVAAGRMDGTDVSVTACDACPLGITDQCHETFGYVELANKARVGLFPFTKHAAHKWLVQVDTHGVTGLAKTPRSLLMYFIRPAIEKPDAFPENFPDHSVTLPTSGQVYWTAFEQQYCGGWSPQERKRLQRLCTAWIDVPDAESAAAQLSKIRAALGFPLFSQGVPVAEPAFAPARSVAKQEPVPRSIPEELRKLLKSLEKWRQGETLADDGEARDLLHKLVRDCIPWPDLPIVPPKERQSLLSKKNVIEIQGQRSRASGAIIHFPRNDETAQLIEALARFSHLGKDSWNFEDGERFKRIVAAWLRSHTSDVVDALQPRGLDQSQPLRVAVSFLVLSWVISHQKAFPLDNLDELVVALFEDLPATFPPRLSAMGTAVLTEIQQQHAGVRTMLAQELNVPQGSSTTCNFIDPRTIMRMAPESAKELLVQPLADDYFKDFWLRRYVVLKPLPNVDGLWQAEREALQQIRTVIASRLDCASDCAETLQSYCDELTEVRAIQKKTFPFPHADFDQLWTQRAFTERLEVWKGALERADQVLLDSASLPIATYAARAITDLNHALSVSEDYIEALDQQTRHEVQAVTGDGDPDELAERLVNSLQKVADMDGRE